MNVGRVVNCYGCGVCSAACHKGIISIELNDDGFYEPRINNPDQCNNCGICYDVCAFNHDVCALQKIDLKSWAAWSNDDNIIKKCSSGGIGYEIGKQLMHLGYKVVGCRYVPEERRAEHFIATTEEELNQTIGSKYIQSYTEKAFKQLKRKQEKYLVVGTPCQIDSFRRMIQKFRCEDNFVLVDFFCHSVPSMLGWKYYLSTIPKDIGAIKKVAWRDKEDGGWHNSYKMNISGEFGNFVSGRKDGDLFYKLFLDDLCIGPQCVSACKYKYDHSSADIRIGDLWGKIYKNDQKGVSVVIAFTEKGHKVIDSLNDVTLIEQSLDVVTEGQRKTNAKANPLRNNIIKQLKKKGKIGKRTLLIAYYVRMFSKRFSAYTNIDYIREKLKI